MSELRLGDIIDDFCVKCRRLTNHAIVSLVDGKAAKVRCRTCYNDHDYRHEQAPPTKKELKKAELDAALLASGASANGEADPVLNGEPLDSVESAELTEAIDLLESGDLDDAAISPAEPPAAGDSASAAAPAKKARGRVKRS